MNTIKLNTIGEVFAKGGGDSGSGGGNSGGGSGCIRYLNIANLYSLSDQRMAMALACLVKVSSDDSGVVIGSDYFIKDQLYIEYSLDDVVAIGVMPTIKFLMDGNIMGIEEPLAQLMGNGAIEITEEEFYNLNTES